MAKLIVRYPTQTDYGYVEVELEIGKDISAQTDWGAEAERIWKSLEAKLPLAPQGKPASGGGSGGGGGGGGGSDNAEKYAAENLQQIIRYCKEIADRSGASAKDVCFEHTEFKGKGGTTDPRQIATNRLYPILKSMEEKLASLAGEGDVPSDLAPEEDSPPF